MTAGSLRRRVLYQTGADTPDDLAQPETAWSTSATWWAEVRTPSGRELVNASQQKAVLTHVVTTRYPGFIPAPEFRLVEGQAVYHATAAFDPDGRRRTLVVWANHDPDEVP